MFGIEEYKIYEDFIQLSELVEVKNVFINRTELYASSNGTYIGEYFGVPAILSEEVLSSGPYTSIYDAFNDVPYRWNRVWILGASFNKTSQLDSNDKCKCGENSCYGQSLDELKICKPGKLLSSIKMIYIYKYIYIYRYRESFIR